MQDAFTTNRKLAQQSLFKEREVDNLNALIYGNSGTDSTAVDPGYD